MSVSARSVVSRHVHRIPLCDLQIGIAAFVLATAGCERSTPVVRDDSRGEAAEVRPNIGVHLAQISVRPIEIKSWKEAPAYCRLSPSDGPVRRETADAMIAFMRWVALMVDPVRPPAGGPSYLQEVRRLAAKAGSATMLVPPSGYEAAWEGEPNAATREQASHAAPEVYAVELQVRGTVERGPGASPLLGYLLTHAFFDSEHSGLFGVLVRFCVMPAVDGVSPVYLYHDSTS